MIEQTQKTFKEIQTEYDRLFQTEPIRDEDRGYRWLAAQILKEKKAAGKLLDLACGGGFFLKQVGGLTRDSLSLSGIDISREALELARRQCPHAKLLQGVGESLPFIQESFDVITCLGSLEHFLDIPKALEEMKRVARRDALVAILVPNLFWYKDLASVFLTGRRKERNQTHERFAALGEWRGLFEDLGLEVVKTKKYNGVAKNPWKQCLKDCLIPRVFSYHFLFFCRRK